MHVNLLFAYIWHTLVFKMIGMSLGEHHIDYDNGLCMGKFCLSMCNCVYM